MTKTMTGVTLAMLAWSASATAQTRYYMRQHLAGTVTASATWTYGAWQTGTCSSGSRTDARTAQCVDAGGNVLAAGRCPTSTKPADQTRTSSCTAPLA